MTYFVGEQIDLTYLNKKAVASQPKKSISEATRQAYEIGTQFIFQATDGGFKAAIKIPVAYA